MSVQNLTWVFDHSPTTGNERLVLLGLSNRAQNDDGIECSPKLDTISLDAGVNKRTTMRCIERMEASGDLIVARYERAGKGQVNHYGIVKGGIVVGQRRRRVDHAAEWLRVRALLADEMEDVIGAGASIKFTPVPEHLAGQVGEQVAGQVDEAPKGDTMARPLEPFGKGDTLAGKGAPTARPNNDQRARKGAPMSAPEHLNRDISISLDSDSRGAPFDVDAPSEIDERAGPVSWDPAQRPNFAEARAQIRGGARRIAEPADVPPPSQSGAPPAAAAGGG